ncbi:MAG: hypothetical protein ABI811_22885 [Acidobacteriota bacterium]
MPEVLALPTFTWVAHHSDNFDYYVERDTPAERNIERIKTIAELSRRRVTTLLNQELDARIPFFVVATRSRSKELAGGEMNAFTFQGRGGLYIAAIYGNVGSHEICHVLTGLAWGRPKANWIDEGLAVYSDDEWWELPLHSVARGLLEEKRLAPMKDLIKQNWSGRFPEMVTYPELGSFVKFVYERYGRQELYRLWREGAKQKEIERFEREWLYELTKAERMLVPYPG